MLTRFAAGPAFGGPRRCSLTTMPVCARALTWPARRGHRPLRGPRSGLSCCSAYHHNASKRASKIPAAVLFLCLCTKAVCEGAEARRHLIAHENTAPASSRSGSENTAQITPTLEACQLLVVHSSNLQEGRVLPWPRSAGGPCRANDLRRTARSCIVLPMDNHAVPTVMARQACLGSRTGG